MSDCCDPTEGMLEDDVIASYEAPEEYVETYDPSSASVGDAASGYIEAPTETYTPVDQAFDPSFSSVGEAASSADAFTPTPTYTVTPGMELQSASGGDLVGGDIYVAPPAPAPAPVYGHGGGVEYVGSGGPILGNDVVVVAPDGSVVPQAPPIEYVTIGSQGFVDHHNAEDVEAERQRAAAEAATMSALPSATPVARPSRGVSAIPTGEGLTPGQGHIGGLP